MLRTFQAKPYKSNKVLKTKNLNKE